MNAAVKNRLIHNAVPTLFDIPNPPPLLTPKRCLQKKSATEEKQVPQECLDIQDQTAETCMHMKNFIYLYFNLVINMVSSSNSK